MALQRYGLLLSGEELSSFQPLRSSHYEVDFYLKQAEAALQQQQQQQHEAPQQQQAQGQARLQRQLSSTVKNRRLAYMRRLEQQGEYFSEQTMRERQPLVWQDCIGGCMRVHPCHCPQAYCNHLQACISCVGGVPVCTSVPAAVAGLCALVVASYATLYGLFASWFVARMLRHVMSQCLLRAASASPACACTRSPVYNFADEYYVLATACRTS
jgi:hypothetical protein